MARKRHSDEDILKLLREIVAEHAGPGGHADLKTTSRYIETDPDAQRKLVDLI